MRVSKTTHFFARIFTYYLLTINFASPLPKVPVCLLSAYYLYWRPWQELEGCFSSGANNPHGGYSMKRLLWRQFYYVAVSMTSERKYWHDQELAKGPNTIQPLRKATSSCKSESICTKMSGMIAKEHSLSIIHFPHNIYKYYRTLVAADIGGAASSRQSLYPAPPLFQSHQRFRCRLRR